MKNYSIRAAQINDLDKIINLCQLHAEYEQADYDKAGKAKMLEQALFKQNPALHCLVVTHDEVCIGYATYMEQFSTWDAMPYIYMDCLFILADFRSLGIGEQLINQIKAHAKDLGCDLIQWQTPEFNTRAIKFYNRIGATSKSKERFFLSC